MSDIAFIENCIAARSLPSNELDGEATEHHDPGSFRIDPNVVFGGGSYVSFATGSASHHHAASDLLRNRRLSYQREGKIGKRPKRDDHEAGIPFNGFDHRVDSMQLAGRLTGRRVVMISEAVAAMKPGRAFMHSKQRLLGANKHRNAGSAEFDCIKRVAGG